MTFYRSFFLCFSTCMLVYNSNYPFCSIARLLFQVFKSFDSRDVFICPIQKFREPPKFSYLLVYLELYGSSKRLTEYEHTIVFQRLPIIASANVRVFFAGSKYSFIFVILSVRLHYRISKASSFLFSAPLHPLFNNYLRTLYSIYIITVPN